jgi:hypothetical protein
LSVSRDTLKHQNLGPLLLLHLALASIYMSIANSTDRSWQDAAPVAFKTVTYIFPGAEEPNHQPLLTAGICSARLDSEPMGRLIDCSLHDIIFVNHRSYDGFSGGWVKV